MRCLLRSCQRVCHGSVYLQLGFSAHFGIVAALNLSLSAVEEIYAALNARRAPTMTQSAAVMVDSTSKKYSTLCRPLDALLDGGIGRGSCVEISGPPGSAKEFFAEMITRSFVEEKEEVLFVGELHLVSNSHELDNNHLYSVRHAKYDKP